VAIATVATLASAEPIRLPRGSRPVEAGLFASGVGFGEAREHLSRELARAGFAAEVKGPSRHRGVDLVRYLLPADAPLSAIHLFRKDGKTWIFLLKRPGADAP
jgi:hypothetical protein